MQRIIFADRDTDSIIHNEPYDMTKEILENMDENSNKILNNYKEYMIKHYNINVDADNVYSVSHM